MKRTLKKLMAVVMAVLMCVPSNAATVLAANVDITTEDTTEESKYVVTIDSVEHGVIKFTDYETVSTKEFMKGESVKVTLEPDKDYGVTQMKVTNTDTGKVLAQKDTTDNKFAFAMPAKNVTVTAIFDKKEKSINLPDNSEEVTESATEGDSQNNEKQEELSDDDEEGESKNKKEDSTEISGTDESSLTSDIITLNLDEEIAEEVEQIAQDGLKASKDVNEKTFEYEDPNLVSEYDENGLAQTGHFVSMLYTIADKEEIKNLGGIPEGADVSDWLFNGDEHITAFYTSMGEEVPIYATKESDDYYIAFVDVSKINRMGDCIYYTINTVDSENPESLEHLVKYDQETGILYIPKIMYYNVEGKEHGAAFNMQLILSCDVSYDAGKTRVEIENHNNKLDIVADEQTISTDLYDITTRIPLATKETAKYFNQNHVKVYVNDSSVPMTDDGDSIAFNQETGELEIAHSGLTLYSVKVVIEDDTISEKIISTFTKEAKAIKAADIKTMKKLSSFSSIQAKINGGDHDGEGAKDGSGNPILVKNVLEDGELYTYNGVYCYAPGSVTVPDDAQRACLMGGIASSGNYLYWMSAVKEGDVNNTFRTGTVAENDWDGGSGKNIINDNVSLAASTQKSKYNVDFKGVYVDFVAQAPGAKTLTPVKVNGTKYKINLANDRDEWLRSKKTHKAHNVNVHGNPGTDIACTGNSSTDNKSNLIQWKSSGDWNNASSKTVGDVTFNTGTANTTNSRSLLAMRCTQENSGTNGTTLDSNHKIYFRVLKHSKENHYIIFAITVDNASSQSGHGIYKVTYSDTPTSTPCAITIRKTMKDGDYYQGNPNYDVEGATYRLYTDAACTTAAKNEDDEYIDFEIEHDAGHPYNYHGAVTRDDVPAGTYYLKEVDVNVTEARGVLTDDHVYGPIEVQATDSTKDTYHPASSPFVIAPESDPGIKNIILSDENRVDDTLMNLKKKTNSSVPSNATAEFMLEFDTEDGSGWTKVSNVNMVVNENGFDINSPLIRLHRFWEIPDSGGSWKLGVAGKYKIYEVATNSSYTSMGGKFIVNGNRIYDMPTESNPFEFAVRQVGNDLKVFIEGETVQLDGIYFEANNNMKYEGFKIKKEDATDSTNKAGADLTATFQLIAGTGADGTKCTVNPSPTTKNNETGVTYEPGQVINIPGVGTTFKTDKNGNYTSPSYLLSPGTYTVKEINAPAGYRLNSTSQDLNINGANVEGTVVGGPTFKNEPMTGSFAFRKMDNQLLNSNPQTQGSGKLNATFELVNDNDFSVLYKNNTYAKGAVMDTFTLNENNKYSWFSGANSQANGALRLGKYIIREKTNGTGYKNTKIKDAYGLDTNNEIKFTLSAGVDNQVIWSGPDDFGADVKSYYKTNYPAIASFNDDATYSHITGNTNEMRNSEVRTGFEVHKVDADTNTKNNVDMTASFKLVYHTNNGKPVRVDKNKNGQLDNDELFNNGDTVFEFTTDSNGDYYSSSVTNGDKLLPYTADQNDGVYYELIETKSPNHYYMGQEYDTNVKFYVDCNGEDIAIYTCKDNNGTNKTTYGKTEYTFATDKKYPDEAQTGAFALQKLDNEIDKALAQGGGELNAKFELINNTGRSIMYKNRLYENGKKIDEFTLSKANNYTWFSGSGPQEDGGLRWGSYIIKEVTAGTGYQNTNTKDVYGFDTNNELHFTIDKENEVVWSGPSTFEATVKSHYGTKPAAAPFNRANYVYTKLTGNTPLNTMENAVKRSGFEIHKVDYETMTDNGRDMTASFKLVYRNTKDSNQPVVVDKNKDGQLNVASETFYNGDTIFEFTTDTKGNYKSSSITNGDKLLPYTGPVGGGVYYELYETKPPKGYWSIHEIDDQIRFFIYVTDEGVTVYKTNGEDTFSYEIDSAHQYGDESKLYEALYSFENDQKIPNIKKRYDINFTKKKEGEIDSKLLANVPFKITLLDDNGEPVESHIVWTDESGYYDSASDYASHRLNTNYGDNYTTYEKNNETYYELDKSNLQANREGAKLIGTWFYGTAGDHDANKIFDYAGRNHQFKIGAFPDGNYTIEELRCEANEGLRLFSDTFNLQAFEDYYNKDLGTYDNSDYKLTTVALTQDTDSHYAVANDELIIVDELLYAGLEKGKTFTIETSLHDVETGALLYNKDNTPASKTTTFESKATNGMTKIEMDFDATGYEGKDIVVYERVYDEKGSLLIEEVDPTYEEQQIHFVGIDTLLTDNKSEDHLAKAEKGVKFTDVITYKNLELDRTYKIKGYLVDAETLDYARDDKGRKITAEKSFKPTKSNGTVEVEYEFDGETLAGKTFVAFEYLTRGGYEVAVHEDIDDADQTIHFPEIGTTAFDEENGTQMSFADDAITVIDTVAYKNVIPGYSYKVSGTLVDKATNKPIKDADGNDIVGESIFAPENADGEIDVVFNFDGTGMESYTLVAFENLYMTKATVNDEGENTFVDIDIAEHSDIDDVNETIYIPKIGTVAKDTENGTHMSLAKDKVSLTDTVEYKNLVPGLKYQIEGFLIDKTADGDRLKDAEGNDITSMVEFTPEKADGEIDVVFEFDGSNLEGHTLVVYEYSYVMVTVHEIDEETDEEIEREERRIIGKHDDIEDEGQTIHFPDVNTVAYDNENQLNVTKSGEKLQIKDTVAYANVIVGEEYVITGRLYDKKTKEVLKDKDGNEITASTKFVAQETSGAVEIVFDVDTSSLAGHRLVAFEKLLYKDYEIGKHENPDDEDETVYIPKIGTSLVDKNDMHISLADDGTATLTDTVSYEKLAPGYTYIMVGQLMDKATKKPIKVLNADNAESVMKKLKDAIAENDEKAAPEEEPEKEDNGELIVGRDIRPGYYKLTGKKDAQGNVFANWSLYASEDNRKVSQERKTPVANGVITDNENPEYIRLVNNQVLKLDDNVIIVSSTEAEADPNLSATLKAYYDGLTDEQKNQKAATSKEKAKSSNTNSNEYVIGTDLPAGYYKVVGTPDENGNVSANWSLYASEDNKTIPEDRTMSIANGVVTDNNAPEYIRVVNNQVLVLDKSAVTVAATEEEVGTNLNSTLQVYYAGLTADEMDQEIVKPEEVPEPTEEEKKQKEAENALKLIANKRQLADNSFDWATLSDGTKVKFSDTFEEDLKVLDGTAVCMLFTPNEADGSVDIKFDVNAADMKGITTVAFEELYLNGYSVADHKDIEDEGQSIHFPDVHTTATDKEKKSHYSEVNTKTTIQDVVTYKNLIVGEKYKVTGTLMDKNLKTAVVDANGKPITTEAEFKAEEPDGTITMDFVFDSTNYAGHNLVVFEDIYAANGVLIGKHENYNDKDQTVNIVKIHTLAVDSKTETNVVAEGTTTIVDTVYYEGLTPGETYVMSGILMDKETKESLKSSDSGDPVATLIANVFGKSNEYISETSFVPESSSGTVQIKFNIDTTNHDGKTLVAFEKLYYGATIIGKHEDIDDKDQTVYVPKLGTKASVDGKDNAEGGKNTKLVDTVEYTNLVPGKEYTIKGTLMDKSTEKPFKVGGKEVTATKTFTPTESSGTVKLTFKFDSTKADKLVAFERLYYNNIEVANHTDIKDEDQTVTFKKPKTEKKKTTPSSKKTSGEKVKTGDSWMLIIILLILGGGSFGAYAYTKKKKKLIK